LEQQHFLSSIKLGMILFSMFVFMRCLDDSITNIHQ